jgi:tetratricopeptide (TPR) repeat protein
MSSSAFAVQESAGRSSVSSTSIGKGLRITLCAVALIYAFLAGLRTVSDFDLGWQLATGRWVAQHHHVPSADVFSYTAQGHLWIYPVGSGLVLYAGFLLGNYAFLSWMGALACVATIALLLWRGSTLSAAIAIIAVPAIAMRTAPRAEMFTVVLFAAFLSILWQRQRTGQGPLWLLPLLMIAWVNLHLGFIAGLALLLVFAIIEPVELLLSSPDRSAGMQRLKRAYPWFVATAAATLVNPWGWGIYGALIRQNRAMAVHSHWLVEWGSVPLKWTAVASSFSLRDTKDTFYLLLTIAGSAALIALFQRQVGAAILLVGAMYEGAQHIRMEALFACVVVVVGGAVLSSVIALVGADIPNARVSFMAAIGTALVFTALALVRSSDLVSNRYYLTNISNSTFGTGLSWWFPERAIEFIRRTGLPGEIFNAYDLGGYVIWRLGPSRRDYIDGRAIPFGPDSFERHDELLRRSPDATLWQKEAERYNINTIILPLARYDGVQAVNLADFCASNHWRPVYLDEVSGVFVRRTAQTEDLIQRYQVDCAIATLPAGEISNDRAAAFNTWANAASLLAALGRNDESLRAADNALAIVPSSSFVHWVRANVLFATGHLSDAEQEYLAAISLDPSEATYSALADSYRKRGRIPAAISAMERAAQLSLRPQQSLVALGYLYLSVHQPEEALKAFDKAVASAPAASKDPSHFGSFYFMVAQGRAASWDAQGDMEKATSYQEEAARLAPDVPQPWRRLAQFYERRGRLDDAKRAREHAAEVARQPNP